MSEIYVAPSSVIFKQDAFGCTRSDVDAEVRRTQPAKFGIKCNIAVSGRNL